MIKLNLQFFGGRGGSSGKSGSPNLNDEQTLIDTYKGINPNFKADKGALDKDGFNNNCVKCALAFEANARGANVKANAYEFGKLGEADMSRDVTKAFTGNDSEVWAVGRNTKSATVREIELTMKDYGNGSRAVIQEHSAGRKHTMNVINRNGTITIVDAQSGTHGSVSKMLTGINTKNITLMRTDNAQIKSEYSNWAYKNK